MRAEVLEQRLVRVSLEAPLDDGPVTFNYRVSNGLAEAEGVITVVEVPAPTRIQPPVANDDSITVRVGEAIDIPVLANDEHPDGLDLTLVPQLAQELPDGAGLLFASGRELRYLAPDMTGDFTAAYQVAGPDGQSATALLKISVREPDAATNNAPVAETVIARVLAGETVRVTIPLAGIDPDGDSVQLLGQADQPREGRGALGRRRHDRVPGRRLLGRHRHLHLHGHRRARREVDRHRARRHQPAARRCPQSGRDRRRGHRAAGRHRLGAGARERLRP